MRSICFSVWCAVLLPLLVGCARSHPKPPVIVPDPPYFHTITHHGETLSIIASWYSGNSHNWPALVKANPEISPSKLKKGQRLVIPTTLLKRRAPLPKSYVLTHLPKSSESAGRSSARSIPNDHVAQPTEALSQPEKAAVTAEEATRRKKVLEELLD